MQQLDDITTVKDDVISAGHTALYHDPVPARHLEQKTDKKTHRRTVWYSSTWVLISPESVTSESLSETRTFCCCRITWSILINRPHGRSTLLFFLTVFAHRAVSDCRHSRWRVELPVWFRQDLNPERWHLSWSVRPKVLHITTHHLCRTPCAMTVTRSHQGGGLILLLWVRYVGEVRGAPVLQAVTDGHWVGRAGPSCRRQDSWDVWGLKVLHWQRCCEFTAAPLN